MAPRDGPPGGLRPALGLGSATLLVIGSVVGSGIFLTPGIVAGELPSVLGIHLVWVVGGLLALAGALTLAELGGMFPRAGGQYVFLTEAFGKGAGFLFGWMALVVNYTGTIAAVAAAFALYLGVLVGFSALAAKFAALLCIWVLTGINLLGVRQGGLVQNLATVAKLTALCALVVAALLVTSPPPPANEVAPVAPSGPVVGFMLALTAALFAFDGLGSATFVGSEIRNAPRNVPRATALGALIVIAVYLAVNAAFLDLVPLPRMAGNPLVAFDAAEALFGGTGGRLMAAAIVVATFGTMNGYILQSPRIYYAMARDRVLYQGFGRLHPRFATPAFGLIIQAELASLLVLTGTFEELIVYVVMSSWLFYAFTGVALFVLRRRRPDHPRPYRTWGYPFVPALFVLSALVIVTYSLLYDTRNALIGIGLALSGLPVYLIVRARAPKTDS